MLSVIRPKFSGMLGEALDIAARWSGDVVSIPFLFFLHFLSLVCYYHILKNSMLLSYVVYCPFMKFDVLTSRMMLQTLYWVYWDIK